MEPDVFALGQSKLNGFLFADIGIEANGMPLSVISALARQGLEPWQEAERLAKLPHRAATEGLAGLIAALPASPWPMPDATAIAARLVALLPGRGEPPGNPTPDGPRTPPDADARPGGPWLIAAIVTMAVLAGLAIYSIPATTGPTPARPAAGAPTTAVPVGD